jgi:hypothetical protein
MPLEKIEAAAVFMDRLKPGSVVLVVPCLLLPWFSMVLVGGSV